MLLTCCSEHLVLGRYMQSIGLCARAMVRACLRHPDFLPLYSTCSDMGLLSYLTATSHHGGAEKLPAWLSGAR
jgi:hypothetical protein